MRNHKNNRSTHENTHTTNPKEKASNQQPDLKLVVAGGHMQGRLAAAISRIDVDGSVFEDGPQHVGGSFACETVERHVAVMIGPIDHLRIAAEEREQDTSKEGRPLRATSVKEMKRKLALGGDERWIGLKVAQKHLQ